MEASALTTASHSGLLARRTPLIRLQGDEKLVALIRDGHDRAFEVLFERYQSRLLAFCRQLLGSLQDAEDVLQEVFVSAHTAMLADQRPINARPWLYRIARNRCLNHLRRPVAEGQDSMDVHPHQNGATTLERVQSREQLREIVSDVQELPETQRTALVLREIDDLCYTEIAQAMGTTLPAVKSLLVRARMSLAECSEARILTCDEVRLELAEAAEGLAKVSGAGRRHVRDCKRCALYRTQLRSSTKAIAALAAPVGLLTLLRQFVGAKLGGGSAAGGAGGSAGSGAAAGTAGGGAAAAGGSGATFGGALGAAGSAAGGIGGAIGAKAAVGMATAALLTVGAVGMHRGETDQATPQAAAVATEAHPDNAIGFDRRTVVNHQPASQPQAATTQQAAAKSTPAAEVPAAEAPAAEAPATASDAPADDSVSGAGVGDGSSTDASSGDSSGVGGADDSSGDQPLPPVTPEPVPTPTDPPPQPDPVTTPDDSTQPPPDAATPDAATPVL